jgi:hypothetical protein
MLKKIILGAMIAATISNANSLNTGINNIAFDKNMEIHNIKQKNINNLEDYELFEKDCLKAINMGKYEFAYYLGLLYSNNFDFKKADYEKSTKYINIASKNNIGQASLYMANMLIRAKKLDYAILYLDRISNEEPNQFLKISRNNMFATIVLDNSLFNKLDLAIDRIEWNLSILKESSPTNQFLLANLYNMKSKSENCLSDDKDLYLKKANIFLTKSCKNPNADTRLFKICTNYKVKN